MTETVQIGITRYPSNRGEWNDDLVWELAVSLFESAMDKRDEIRTDVVPCVAIAIPGGDIGILDNVYQLQGWQRAQVIRAAVTKFRACYVIHVFEAWIVRQEGTPAAVKAYDAFRRAGGRNEDHPDRIEMLEVVADGGNLGNRSMLARICPDGSIDRTSIERLWEMKDVVSTGNLMGLAEGIVLQPGAKDGATVDA